MLNLYSMFHCNLAFSLIPSQHYGKVIDRCYKPILDLCEKGIPLALEMPAWTLKEINKIDPAFIERLSALWSAGKCEFIGSGYSQAIMPLIPADVNRWNIESGNLYYEHLLGRKPAIALVNEQTWSRGLADLYRDAGYEAVIMDWNNCYQHNRYPREYQYYPQRAAGINGDIKLMWSHSIGFQKFQRCVHGEITIDEYLEWLFSHDENGTERGFVLYANDAEVFDFRPGQETFPDGEFKRIAGIFERVAADGRARFVSPSQYIERLRKEEKAFNLIQLESPETPIVCKKQDKYNPVRWAVAGRDSAHINTECYKVYNNIKALLERGSLPELATECFKEALCELWSSDFRTNTIDEKFRYFQDRLGWLKLETERLAEREARRLPAVVGMDFSHHAVSIAFEPRRSKVADLRKLSRVSVKSADNILKVCTDEIEVEFLKNKGCAIKSVVFPKISPLPLVGTLQHGYYDDIHLGADFFSGHLIHNTRDGRKSTDLKASEPEVSEDSEYITVTVESNLEIGHLKKVYEISKQEPEISVTYRLKVNGLLASSLRLGIFTLIPSAFDRETIWVETVNGGTGPERFYLRGRRLSHDEPVSQSVSASGCLGATEGWVRVGDKDKSISIHTDKSKLYSIPMLRFTDEPQDSFFLRVYHSLGEVDDTAWWVWRGYNEITFTLRGDK